MSGAQPVELKIPGLRVLVVERPPVVYWRCRNVVPEPPEIHACHVTILAARDDLQWRRCLLTGVILAQVGFLLILFAGIWLAAAQIPLFRFARERTVVAGIALALAGVLLIIATRWGHFGQLAQDT